jgi:hypothetical protein
MLDGQIRVGLDEVIQKDLFRVIKKIEAYKLIVAEKGEIMNSKFPNFS